MSDHARQEKCSTKTLCERCKCIDFDEIFTRKFSCSDKIVPIVSLERLPPENCTLCELFAQYCGDNWGEGWLCAVSWERTMKDDDGCWGAFPDVWMLSILPSRSCKNAEALIRDRGYISEPINHETSWELGPPGPRLIEPGFIDYSLINTWLGECQIWHGIHTGCKPFTPEPEWPIRFIDCETCLVVEAASLESPCPPFLALSYVWGQATNSQSQLPVQIEPLEDLPDTIIDSMVVTLKLGFRYLWVDRYCIRQDDEIDKRLQIPLMEKIYGSAQLTIIAVAGSDPSYGLPGVTGRPRHRQPRANVGNRTLTWAFSFSSLRDEILSSVWFSRGWTYQEGILSPRRLIFTDKQVYFQCQDSGFYETVNMPLCLVGWHRRVTVFPPVRIMGLSEHIGDRIQEYTRRDLGYQGDILNAFQAIFSLYASQSIPNIWGVPIDIAIFNTQSYENFLAGISWTLEKPGHRRHEFPSWTWAGWKAAVADINPEYHARFFYDDGGTGISVSFESPNGTTTEWQQVEPTLGADGGRDDLRILVLNCHSIKLQASDFVADSSERTSSLKVIGDVPGVFYPIDRDSIWGLDQAPLCQLLGVPLGIRISYKPGSWNPSFFMLVVQRKGQFWERVGHIEWRSAERWPDVKRLLTAVSPIQSVLRII